MGWLIRSARYLPAVAGILAIVLALPALSVGWMLDDYYHRAILLEVPRFRELLGPPAEMFRFFRGDPARMGRLMDLGLFPWWTDPYIKAEFLQALTILTHRLDYVLWPDSPVLMHAQSLFWLGAAVAAAAAFYQRIMGPTWVAAVAALLFAVDDARGTPVGFLANRNVLIAATFGFLALNFHDRFRRMDRARRHSWLRSCSWPHSSPRKRDWERALIWPRMPFSSIAQDGGAAAWPCCRTPPWSSPGELFAHHGATGSGTWAFTSIRSPIPGDL